MVRSVHRSATKSQAEITALKQAQHTEITALKQAQHTEITALKQAQHAEMQKLQQDINDTTLRFFQRAPIIQLWNHVSELEHINRHDPAVEVIRKNLNALELLATCRRHHIVDKIVLDEVLLKMALDISNALLSVNLIEWEGKTRSGREILGLLPNVKAMIDEYEKSQTPSPAPPL
jgi:hypothetical protein